MSFRPGGDAAATVIFDTQAIHLLSNPMAKPAISRRLIARIEGNARRKKNGFSIDMIVPTTVRAEAIWDRQNRANASINRYLISDVPMSVQDANKAAEIRASLGPRISVTDAHIGAILFATKDSGPHSVLSSDHRDLRDISGYVDVPITLPKL